MLGTISSNRFVLDWRRGATEDISFSEITSAHSEATIDSQRSGGIALM